MLVFYVRESLMDHDRFHSIAQKLYSPTFQRDGTKRCGPTKFVSTQNYPAITCVPERSEGEVPHTGQPGQKGANQQVLLQGPRFNLTSGNGSESELVGPALSQMRNSTNRAIT